MLEVIDNEIDDKPSGDRDDESDNPMLDGVSSFFLVFGSESHEAHLKGSVDNRDHGYGPSESEDDIGRTLDDSRNIAERDISFAELGGCYTSSAEYARIVVGKNVFRKNGS